MSEELKNRITKLKAKLSKLDPNSQIYQGYRNTLREAEAQLAREEKKSSAVTLHKAVDSVCESCEG